MKVLHLIPQSQRRGAEIFATELLHALSAEGLEGKLAVLFNGHDELELAHYAYVRQLRAKSGLTAMRRLRALISEYDPDIIMAYGGEPLKYAVLSTGTRKRPSLVYRKIGLSRDWFGRSGFLKLPFYRWLAGRADFVSCVGEASRKEIVDLFHVPPDKAGIIYRGVAAEKFVAGNKARSSIRDSLGVQPDTTVLISVGALSWEKNHAAMVKTAAVLNQRGKDVILLLAGKGPLERELLSLADRMGAAKQVRFLGVRNDVPLLLQAADIALLSSFTEGVPGALIEAGFAGLPAVAWDVGGAREVVLHEKTGIITPYKDERAFLEAVRKLTADKNLRQQMGRAACEFCTERFDIKTCANEHIKLFEKLLSKSDK